MAKISKKSPVPAKLYRHFAVVTVALTACLAMFANGENEEFRESVQAERSVQVQAAATTREDEDTAPAYGQAQLARRDGAANAGFNAGPEFDPNYGRASGGPSSHYISSQVVPAQNSENAAFTASHLDKLSEEELQRLLEALREDGIANEAERLQAVAVMEAASRRRSGHRISS